MSVGTRLRRFAEKLGLLRQSTVRTARARLERALGSKPASVFERTIETGDGRLRVFESTDLPAPIETVVLPDSDQIGALNEKAEAVSGFFVAFIGRDPGPDWTLDELDTAFATWLNSDNKKYYSKQTVIAITGAAFGNYLIRHLGMHWLWYTDADGSAWAVRDAVTKVTGFPHHSVAKRIDDSEFGFFRPVFQYLERLVLEERGKGVA